MSWDKSNNPWVFRNCTHSNLVLEWCDFPTGMGSWYIATFHMSRATFRMSLGRETTCLWPHGLPALEAHLVGKCAIPLQAEILILLSWRWYHCVQTRHHKQSGYSFFYYCFFQCWPIRACYFFLSRFANQVCSRVGTCANGWNWC